VKLKRLFHSVWALGFVACSDSPIAPPPPPPPPIPPTLSVTTNEVGPESALVHASANTAVAWRVFWGSTLAFGDTTPETSPSPELNQTLRGLRALTTYYYQVEARLDSLRVRLSGEFRTPDYPVCDNRNTTTPTVTVTITWTSPTPPVMGNIPVLDNVDLRDCNGRVLTQNGDQFFSGSPGTVQMRVNYGSGPHWFGGMVFTNDIWFVRWVDASEFRVNGVRLTQPTDSMPPTWPCRPDVGCIPGPRWKFWVDSLGGVHS